MTIQQAIDYLAKKGRHNLRAHLIIYRNFIVLKNMAAELNISDASSITKKQLAHKITLLLQKRLDKKELLVKRESQVHEMIGSDSIRFIQDFRNTPNHISRVSNRSC
jgi:hypothetical protein